MRLSSPLCRLARPAPLVTGTIRSSPRLPPALAGTGRPAERGGEMLKLELGLRLTQDHHHLVTTVRTISDHSKQFRMLLSHLVGERTERGPWLVSRPAAAAAGQIDWPVSRPPRPTHVPAGAGAATGSGGRPSRAAPWRASHSQPASRSCRLGDKTTATGARGGRATHWEVPARTGIR